MRDELESSRRVDLRVIKGKLLNVIQKIRGAKSGYKTAQKEEDMSGFRVAGTKVHTAKRAKASEASVGDENCTACYIIDHHGSNDCFLR